MAQALAWPPFAPAPRQGPLALGPWPPSARFRPLPAALPPRCVAARPNRFNRTFLLPPFPSFVYSTQHQQRGSWYHWHRSLVGMRAASSPCGLAASTALGLRQEREPARAVCVRKYRQGRGGSSGSAKAPSSCAHALQVVSAFWVLEYLLALPPTSWPSGCPRCPWSQCATQRAAARCSTSPLRPRNNLIRGDEITI
jgi:hypothetical protein